MGRDRVADGRALRHAAEVVIVVAFFFWTAVGLLVFTQVGYPVVLWALARLRRSRPADAPEAASRSQEPSVSVIVAAHDEEAVIARRIANLLELDYPRDQLEVIVASDGSEDRTVELARAAGADEVLDLDRVGEIAAQNEAALLPSGVVLAFSDANATWAPDALRALLARFEDPRVAYVCGQVSFTSETGQNQEGLYWRYEMALRTLESELGGVTAGNGAIYAVRRGAYMYLGPSRSHDLSFPFELTKRGHRALYAAEAVASEKLVPTLEGEFARKRRMMRGLWDIVVRDGMLSPRGYEPLYAFQIASHRLLRYLSPFLHLVALGTNIALLGQGPVYLATFGAQLALLGAAAIGSVVKLRALRIPYYYVLVTASIAAGLWDRARRGAPSAWEKAAGTR